MTDTYLSPAELRELTGRRASVPKAGDATGHPQPV